MSLNVSNQIASEITIHSKYARHNQSENRRETWNEIIDRCQNTHIKRFPHIKEDIVKAFSYVRDKQVLPSMRFLQFGGKAIELNHARGYNCAYMAADDPKFFNELMFLLLGGSGVGYSVQHRHISNLPVIQAPKKEHKFVVQDSIVGWADSVKALMSAYLLGKYLPRFDFSDIRHKGALLKTAGGKAPGPSPLRTCLARVQGILEAKQVGTSLSSVEVSDIACILADAVLAGGIRRSAMLALFDINDVNMLAYKSGDWYELNPERARVNVSAVALRGITSRLEFDKQWQQVEVSGSGEPGIYWSNDPDMGVNPCNEVALRNMQFCNLCTINFALIKDNKQFLSCVWAASLIGTLQASYTDFHYLRPEWKHNCEEEALLGISLTGIGDNKNYKDIDFTGAAQYAKVVNAIFADKIGINPSARLTCIKPEGTASLVLGTSSGLHGRYAEYYIRRMRFNRNEPIAEYLLSTHPELMVDDVTKPDGVILELPQESPKDSIYRYESPLETLERLKYFYCAWVQPGHAKGNNTHNVSCTISVKSNEWPTVGQWMWENKAYYNGISVLPYDGGSYVQAPFEEITKEEFDKRFELLKGVDLTKVLETEDETAFVLEAACAGGSCSI